MDAQRLTRRGRSALVLGLAIARVATVAILARATVRLAGIPLLSGGASWRDDPFAIPYLVVHVVAAAVVWRWAPTALERVLRSCRPAEALAREAPWVAVALASVAGYLVLDGVHRTVTRVVIVGHTAGAVPWMELASPAGRAVLGAAILGWLPALTLLWARANRRRPARGRPG